MMKQLTKLFFPYMLLFSLNSTFGQATKLGAIVEEISKINQVQHQRIGYGGIESENFKNFKKLKALASTEELVQLTDHNNATVACYASWALADNAYPDLKTIFQKFIDHDKQVETYSGCIQSPDFISSELYHWYWNHLELSKRPSDQLLCELDSIVLFSPKTNWLLLNRALENRVYSEPIKSRIALLAFEKGNMDAVLYLSNWHKAAYVDEIKTALLRHLNTTNFKNTGTTDYYRTIEELFKFKDNETKKAIIAKMKKDRHWEVEKARFKYLLEDNYIYDIDQE
jgi:hypothetical protein